MVIPYSFDLLNPCCFAARQKATAAFSGSSSIRVGENAIHPYTGNALSGTYWVSECGSVDNLLRIEKYEIGKITLANQAALCQPEALSRHSRHLMNGFGQRKQFFFAAVASQDTGECSP